MSHTSNIRICSKAELQQDFVPHGTGIATSALTSFSANLDQKGQLVVFMIDGNTDTVYRARRSLEVDGNSFPTWVIEDTHFPRDVTQPRFIDSFLQVIPPDSPSEEKKIHCAVTGADNRLYYLDPNLNFPTWTSFRNHWGETLRELKFHTTTDFRTMVSVRTDGQILILEPEKRGSELTPLSLFDDNAASFDVGPAFARAKIGSLATWGYIICGTVQQDVPPYVTDGVDICSADGVSARRITLGKYTSVSHATPNVGIGTAPLLFAIDSEKKPTYFKADGTGGFEHVLPFGPSLRCDLLRAVYRRGVDAENKTVEWIDLFAVDDSGKLWHIKSTPSSNRADPIESLPNGDIAVASWCSPTVISKDVVDFDLAGDGSGPAFLVVRHKGDHPLAILRQDPVSTSWSSTHLRPAVSRERPQDVHVEIHHVYFVLVTVYKDDARASNLSVKVDSPDYCEVEINGVVTTVGPDLRFSTHTNCYGDVSITIPAHKRLGCPSFSVWAEGMDTEHRVDIVPTGSIMKKFKDITGNQLANAKDPTTDHYLFEGVSSSDLRRLATRLNEVGGKFAPQDCNCTNTASAAGEDLGKKYIHPHTLPEISRSRHVSQPHFARVFTQPRCTNCHSSQPSDGTINVIKRTEFNQGEVDYSWGDLWMASSLHELSVDEVDINPDTSKSIDASRDVGLGVQITLHNPGESIGKVWNGVVHFVEQGFDIIANWFISLGSSTKKAFNWLAYLFNWDDIKKTAAGFRRTFHEQIDKIKECHNDTRPKLRNFFPKARRWLDDNLDGATREAEKCKVADYDNQTQIPTNITQLPSSSSWMSSKVMNVVTNSNSAPSLPVNDVVKAAWVKFMNKLYDIGISTFDSAFEDVSVFFSNINSKADMDGFTLAEFINKVFKKIVNVFLNFTENVMDDVIEVALATLDVVKDFFNTTIDMPVLSSIFKKVGLADLTLLDLIVLPLAVPSTILYKAFIGHAPFWDEGAGLQQIEASHDLTLVWALILNLLYGGLDAANDLSTRKHLGWVSNLMSGSCWVVACLQTGLGLYNTPFNPRTNYTNVASAISCAVGISSFISSFIEPTVFKGGQSFVVKIVRAIVPVGTGVALLVSAVWHIVNIFITGDKDDSARDIAVTVGEYFFCVPSLVKVLSWTENPKATLALLLVDVIGYGVSTTSFGIAEHNND